MSSNSLIYKYRYEILLLLVLIFSFGSKLYRLEIPKSYYFDEVYYAFTAQEMAKGNREAWQNTGYPPEDFAYEWTHPPLGKEISALGILVFGDNTFGWRFFQALFGGLGALLIYLVCKNLFLSKGVGLLAALLYSLDSFVFVLSRITMVDIFTVDFLLLATLFIIKYARSRKYLFLILAGVFSGAAMSIKWSGVYIWIFLTGVAFFITYYYEVSLSEVKDRSYIKSVMNIIPRMALAFGVVPLLVYIATYLPFFYFGNSFMDFLSLQDGMYGYHGAVESHHPHESMWWQWPLMFEPIYLHFDDLGEGIRAHIYAIGNPFIWWTGCIFMVLGTVQAVRKENPSLIFAVVSFFALWLPWAVSPRKITFLYHYLPSLIFLLIVIAYFLDRLWNLKSKYGKILVILYLLVAAGMFFYFYPITAAVHMQGYKHGQYMWLESWR